MKEKRSPFDILGVTPADDMTTIRMAWRAKVRVLHPDVVGNTAETTERFAEINAAFDALQGHRPSAREKAAKDAEIDRAVRRAQRAAREAQRQREEAWQRQKAEEAKRRARELAETAERARQDLLRRHKGTLHARAANGYRVASKILTA